MGESIFCPACGLRIEGPARACPACHEPLPAPKTVLGFPELPGGAQAEPQPPAHDPVPALESTWTSPSDAPSGQPKSQSTVPGLPGPSSPPGAPIASARAAPAASLELSPNPADSPGQALADPRPGQLGSGGSTTPGFPDAPAQPSPNIAPSAQPPQPQQAPFAQAPIVQQPEFAQQGGPLPPTGAPPQQEVATAWTGVAAGAVQQPQSPTEPHDGPPAAALNAPAVAQHAPQPQPFVYGQPMSPAAAPTPPPAEPAAALPAPANAESELAPTDTRKGLAWRCFGGGALLTWTLLFGPAATVFVAVHLLLFLDSGLENMHASTFTTFWVAAAALIPTALLLASSVFALSGRGLPRATAVLAALSHVGWSAATLYVLFDTFTVYRSAKYGVVACGVSAVITLVCVAIVLAGGKWVGGAPPGKPARAVPYPLWAGPLLIVLGSLSFVREAIQLARVGFKAAKRSKLEYAAERFYDHYPLFWAGVAALLLAALIVVAGIALLRRKRWAVGLGGAAGLLIVLAQTVAILVVYLGDDLGRYGRPPIGLMDILLIFSYSTAGWVALAGALRFGFLLPRYLRDVPAKGPDGNRLSLMDVLMAARTLPTRDP